jgi:hypothetical protein
LKTTFRGALMGLLFGVVAGGCWSALFGKPFSGATGLKVFPFGMWFPGLLIIAPFTAGAGAIIGAVMNWFRRANR